MKNSRGTSPTGARKGEREAIVRQVPKSTSTRRNIPRTDPKNLHPNTPKPKAPPQLGRAGPKPQGAKRK